MKEFHVNYYTIICPFPEKLLTIIFEVTYLAFDTQWNEMGLLKSRSGSSEQTAIETNMNKNGTTSEEKPIFMVFLFKTNLQIDDLFDKYARTYYL